MDPPKQSMHGPDLVSQKRSSALLWWLPGAAIAATWTFNAGPGVLTAVWPPALLIMGIGCMANALRCGRVHCWFTGPFFLLLAAASLMHGLGVIPLGRGGWRILVTLLAVGGPALYFLPEMILGRYFAKGQPR